LGEKEEGEGEEVGIWRDKNSVEVEERLRVEVKKVVEERERVVRGGQLRGSGVKKNSERGGRGGRRVLGELGNM